MSTREESRETTPRCLVLSVLILILNLNLDPDLFPPASPVLFLFVQDSSGAEGATDVLAPGKRGWLFSSPVFLPLATIPRHWPRIGFEFRLNSAHVRRKSRSTSD